MAEVAGFDIPIEGFGFEGLASSTWIYVLLVFVIGLLLVVGVAVMLFFKTYNKKIVVFENIAGQGYQPLLKTRARVIRLGTNGGEVMKTLAGNMYLTAYGRKMGKNVYWFCKASDGYYYNVVLGDIDTKLNMLDINPIDRDVRMFHVALDRLSQQTYGKTGFFEKYAVHMLLFVFLLVLILGMWFIVGKIGDATSALAATSQTNQQVLESLNSVLGKANNIATGGGSEGGLVPA